MSEFLIRPHHMLCLQFFEGKGYSDDFVENMITVKELLERENPMVHIVNEADMICAHCPHRCGTVCEHEESVCEHDRRVYDKLIDKVGQQAYWSEITKAIFDNIIDVGKMKETCKECQWSDICFNK